VRVPYAHAREWFNKDAGRIWESDLLHDESVQAWVEWFEKAGKRGPGRSRGRSVS